MAESRAIRVVFDANVFIQAALSGRGPAFACLFLVREGVAELMISHSMIEEIEEVLNRLSRVPRYREHLSSEAIASFLQAVRRNSTLCDEPARVFELIRDPDDERYVNLAIATGATLIASRDDDLLHLMDTELAAGREFVMRFPQILILTPTEFLRLFRPEV